jgi:hypothetical protein
VPGTSVTRTVLSLSEANPTMSEAALRTALTALGSGTGAAAALITTFAQDIANVASCDQTAGRKMAAALLAILHDPAYATLAANSPSIVALVQSIATSIGVTSVGSTGTSTATTDTTPGSPTTTTTQSTTNFGNFGSNANTGASTSPAS